MRQKMLMFVCFVLGVPAAAESQFPDHQLRSLFHAQVAADGAAEGFAAWVIVPDLIKPDPFRVLGMAGLLKKSDEGWIELMGGGFVDEHGKVNPVFNLRLLERKGRVILYFEAMHTFPAERFLISGMVMVPVKIGRVRFHVGGESDTIFRASGTAGGFGPRLMVPVPFLRNASLATAYQWQNKRSFIRHYLLVNF